MQQAGTAVYKVEDMEFGRRLAMERELEIPGLDGRVPGRWSNAIWDESGAFILYPSLLGIKGRASCSSFHLLILLTPFPLCIVLNIVTNRVVRLLGKDEVVRFLNLGIYQGAPSKRGLTTMVCRHANPNFFRKHLIIWDNRLWPLRQTQSLPTRVNEIQLCSVRVTSGQDSTCSHVLSLSE